PVPSDKPSGDYVECFHRSRDELLFYVADATGHKDLLPAFTTCLSNMVLHRVHHGRRPTVKEIIQEIDQALEGLREAGAFGSNRFLTFLIGCLDLTNGELTYVNAGHLPAFLLRRPSEEVEVMRLSNTSLAVGQVALLNTEIKEGTEQLRPGDLLFLYTDGVTASLAEDGESDHSPACIKRLEELVKPLAVRPLQEFADEVMARLENKVGERGFQDDTTLLAIRLHKARG
ncbi:MAG: serine/threonine-protein phosphatase, partial [bacterium]|nr:serine/threonine-protein phosphatase [bacterium]